MPTPAAGGNAIYVSPAGTDRSTSGSEDQPFHTIGYGLAHRGTALVVTVAPGTYRECVVLGIAEEGVTLQGVPEGSAVINGDGCEHVVRLRTGLSHATILRGFVIENGAADAGDDVGGGIYVESSSQPTIERNVIRDNFAVSGGGIGIGAGSYPTLQGNVIDANRSAFDGGGINIGEGSPTITNNLLSNNVAGLGRGGGIACQNGCAAKISGNVIKNNRAGGDEGGDGGGYGGGIAVYESSPTITSNLIVGNVATFYPGASYPGGYGGGISSSSDANYSDPQILSNTLAGNSADFGAGIVMDTASPFTDSEALIRWNIIVAGLPGTSGTGGEGIYWSSNPKIRPTIDQNELWQNVGDALAGDTQYAQVGIANLFADPLFVCGPLDAYYLSSTATGQPSESPALDMGTVDASSVDLGATGTTTDGALDTGALDLGYHR